MMSTNFRKQQFEHAMTHDLRNQAMRGQTHPHAQAQFAKGGEQMAALRPAVDKKPRGMERVAFHEVYGVAAEALPAARAVPGYGADGRRGGFVVSFDEEFGEGGHPCKAGKPCACGGSCGGKSPAQEIATRVPVTARSMPPANVRSVPLMARHRHPERDPSVAQRSMRFPVCPVPLFPAFNCNHFFEADGFQNAAAAYQSAYFDYLRCVRGPNPFENPAVWDALLSGEASKAAFNAGLVALVAQCGPPGKVKLDLGDGGQIGGVKLADCDLGCLGALYWKLRQQFIGCGSNGCGAGASCNCDGVSCGCVPDGSSDPGSGDGCGTPGGPTCLDGQTCTACNGIWACRQSDFTCDGPCDPTSKCGCQPRTGCPLGGAYSCVHDPVLDPKGNNPTWKCT